MKLIYNKFIQAAIIIALIFTSVCVIRPLVTESNLYNSYSTSLDEKRDTVLSLTAACSTASAAITLIPGDTGTPIAEKLADFSSYFLIILCAVFLEKYLLVLTGYATFALIIPAVGIIILIQIFKEEESVFLHKLATKLLIFGVAILLVIPASLTVSNIIEDTFENHISETIETAEVTSQEIQDHQNDKTWYQKLTGAYDSATDYLETILNKFVESVAIMIVTACVIPILTLILFYILTKIILGIEIPMPKLSMPKHSFTKPNSSI